MFNSLMDDPARAWSPYEPGPDSPWDAPRVAHLHRRAGFSAPWRVVVRDVTEGPSATLARLLDGESATADGTPADEFEAQSDRMAERMSVSAALTRLQGLWLYRMIFSPHPLRERMTLFWHNHFATSQAKVNNSAMMQRQNGLLRRHALGDFGALLKEMARDPAMLVWLDSSANRKAHPNENFAREIMELFSLGRGKYSEKDIQEAARAFTGSFVQNDRYQNVPSQHDDGEKTLLGRTGRFSGDDVAAILLEQPSCAEFVAGKLFRMFVSDVDAPSPALIAPVAEAFRKANYDVKAPISLILKSKLFHDPAMKRKRVKSPVEFAVGTVRSLEILEPTVSADSLADACSRMGQSLYAPPSVAGWDGGPAWINTTTSLARSNFVLALLGKEDKGLGGRFVPEQLMKKYGADDPGRFFADLLVQDAFDGWVRAKLTGTAREVATLVLTAPEYQLG